MRGTGESVGSVEGKGLFHKVYRLHLWLRHVLFGSPYPLGD